MTAGPATDFWLMNNHRDYRRESPHQSSQWNRLLTLLTAALFTVGCSGPGSGSPQSDSLSAVDAYASYDLCDSIIRLRIQAEEDARTFLHDKPTPRSDELGADPLYCAVSARTVGVVEVLIDRGLSPAWESPTNPRPLLGELRIERRRLDAMDPDDRTTYIQQGNQIVEMLVAGGVDPCATYGVGLYEGFTAYQVAMRKGDDTSIFEENDIDCVVT